MEDRTGEASRVTPQDASFEADEEGGKADTGNASEARRTEEQKAEGDSEEESTRGGHKAVETPHTSPVQSAGEKPRAEEATGTQECEKQRETEEQNRDNPPPEEEEKPTMYRLRVRCAPFNPIVEIAANKTFQDLLKAVAQSTQLPHLEDPGKFSLLAGFPPKRLEVPHDTQISSFLQDGEALTPERRRTSQDEAIICSSSSPISRREGRGLTPKSPGRNAVPRPNSNIHTLSSSSSSSPSSSVFLDGRKETASTSRTAAGQWRRGREAKKGTVFSLGSSEEEVAENLVRLFTDKTNSAAEKGLKKAFSLALHQRYAETTADERWGAVQGRRFTIKEGHPQPGKFTVNFFAPVSGRVDTERTEEYTALPKNLVLLVLSQVWQSAEDVDRHNLRPYYMAHAQPMMFWNIVRHFDGDFGACLRQVLPAAAVQELLDRKRELSEKAKENKRQAEDAARMREEKRLLRAQQNVARALRTNARVQRGDAHGGTPQSETVSSSAEAVSPRGEGKETGLGREEGSQQDAGACDEDVGKKGERSARRESAERRTSAPPEFIQVGESSEGATEHAESSSLEGRRGEQEDAEREGNDRSLQCEERSEAVEGKEETRGGKRMQRGNEKVFARHSDDAGGSPQNRATGPKDRRRKRFEEAEGDREHAGGQETEARRQRQRLDTQKNGDVQEPEKDYHVPCSRAKSGPEGCGDSAVSLRAAASSSRRNGDRPSECSALPQDLSSSQNSQAKDESEKEENAKTTQLTGDVSTSAKDERPTEELTEKRRRRGESGGGRRKEPALPFPEMLLSWAGREEGEDEDYEADSAEEEEEETERKPRNKARAKTKAANKKPRTTVTKNKEEAKDKLHEGACNQHHADPPLQTRVDSSSLPASSLPASSLPASSVSGETRKRGAPTSRGRRRGGKDTPESEKVRNEQQQSAEERRRNLAAAAEARAARQAVLPAEERG
ncbi:hypothetical protein TGPRC2_246090 [Toxoplasma gondii TgCatPRC2]|uniref:ubiquitinyl hydrolase 1 n=3 Tax=Toxoplasma gondii TaxID=5811 RepID=A0A151HGF8_TOXGO|nr:hypothetical protein TGPRC2_246090 [Toxoplasma gondii TgCatPRC2]